MSTTSTTRLKRGHGLAGFAIKFYLKLWFFRRICGSIEAGYAPGALQTMTDWVHRVIDDPAHIATMKQEGAAEQTGVLSKLISYEKLRWWELVSTAYVPGRNEVGFYFKRVRS